MDLSRGPVGLVLDCGGTQDLGWTWKTRAGLEGLQRRGVDLSRGPVGLVLDPSGTQDFGWTWETWLGLDGL